MAQDVLDTVDSGPLWQNPENLKLQSQFNRLLEKFNTLVSDYQAELEVHADDIRHLKWQEEQTFRQIDMEVYKAVDAIAEVATDIRVRELAELCKEDINLKVAQVREELELHIQELARHRNRGRRGNSHSTHSSEGADPEQRRSPHHTDTRKQDREPYVQNAKSQWERREQYEQGYAPDRQSRNHNSRQEAHRPERHHEPADRSQSHRRSRSSHVTFEDEADFSDRATDHPELKKGGHGPRRNEARAQRSDCGYQTDSGVFRRKGRQTEQHGRVKSGPGRPTLDAPERIRYLQFHSQRHQAQSNSFPGDRRHRQSSSRGGSRYREHDSGYSSGRESSTQLDDAEGRGRARERGGGIKQAARAKGDASSKKTGSRNEMHRGGKAGGQAFAGVSAAPPGTRDAQTSADGIF